MIDFTQDLSGLVYSSDLQIIPSVIVPEEYNLTELALSIGMMKPPAYWSALLKTPNFEGKWQFASMADYYAAFKVLRKQYAGNGVQGTNAIRIMVDIIDNLKSMICTSTCVDIAEREKHFGFIRHNYDFELKKDKNRWHSAYIPRGKILLEEALDDSNHATYLGALFRTTDSASEILDTLSFVTRVSSSKLTHINALSPEEKTAAAYMYIENNQFQIALLNSITAGMARGVRT